MSIKNEQSFSNKNAKQSTHFHQFRTYNQGNQKTLNLKLWLTQQMTTPTQVERVSIFIIKKNTYYLTYDSTGTRKEKYKNQVIKTSARWNIKSSWTLDIKNTINCTHNILKEDTKTKLWTKYHRNNNEYKFAEFLRC